MPTRALAPSATVVAPAPAPEQCARAGGGGADFPGPTGLVRGRVHEICGPARRTLALIQAGAAGGAGRGPVIWIAPAWVGERLHAPGLARLTDPGRLVFVACPRAEDLLWCAEEALRQMAAAGSGATVVVELDAPPGLTPVRRLHLAAGGNAAGTGGRGRGPLGLLLTPGDGGAPGVESRWHIAPAHVPGHSVWTLERRRARGAGPAAWRLVAEAGTFRLETGDGDRPATAAEGRA